MRSSTEFLAAFLCVWIKVPICSTANTSTSVMDEFSELVSAQISVTIDPLEVIYENVNQTSHGAYCTLSIHRENCLNPKIRSTETISWHTRICFKWTCSTQVSISMKWFELCCLATHVMRIENCWTGSPRKPIFLIDKNGCTKERTMVSTPRYENSLLAAYSVGYLSVRLVGADQIRLSCTVRLCHVCQAQCPAITPPRRCSDAKSLSTYLFTRWNNTDELDQKCRPDEYRRRLSNNSASSQNNFPLLLSLFIASQMGRFY